MVGSFLKSRHLLKVSWPLKLDVSLRKLCWVQRLPYLQAGATLFLESANFDSLLRVLSLSTGPGDPLTSPHQPFNHMSTLNATPGMRTVHSKRIPICLCFKSKTKTRKQNKQKQTKQLAGLAAESTCDPAGLQLIFQGLWTTTNSNAVDGDRNRLVLEIIKLEACGREWDGGGRRGTGQRRCKKKYKVGG